MDTPPPELASQRRVVKSSSPPAKLLGALALLLSCAAAFLLYANGRALGWPLQHSLGGAAAALVAVPVVWHVLAERQRRMVDGGGTRLLWRCFAVNALLAASAIVSLGPQGAWSRARDHLPKRELARAPAAPAAPVAPAPPPLKPVAPGDGLEAFVPGDATWALRLSGVQALQSMLAANGSDGHEKLEALKKCHIDLSSADVVVAARKPGEVMALVRAPGLSDQGNLYCLVGALGNERLVLRFETNGPSPRFSATGLVPDATVTFAEITANTLLMVAPSWKDIVEQRFAGKGAPLREGLLSEPFSRIDRKANVWAVGVAESNEGARDIAMNANIENAALMVHATAVPAAGRTQMAKLELTLPLDFVRTLPETAWLQGAKGVFEAVLNKTPAQAGAPAP